MLEGRPFRRACFVIALCAARALAQSPPVDPDAIAREAARTLMREGNERLDRGQYLDALDRFERAHQLFPSPKLLFNIAQTLNELGRPLDALDHYERFVHDTTQADAPDLWRIAHEQIFRLQGAIARVEVQTNVADAHVTVDGRPVGVTPLDAPLRLLPGAHAIVLVKAGYERQVVELTLQPGDLASRRVTLRSEGDAAATQRAVQEAEARRRASEARLRVAEEETRHRRERTRSQLRLAGWSAMGAGVVALLAGAILGGLALDASSTVQAAADGTEWTKVQSAYDAASRDRVACWVLLGVGAALAGVGGALVAIGARGRNETISAWLVPAPLADGAGLALAGSF